MKKILIVDDEESIRLSLETMLARNGYHVLTSENGIVALEILKNEDVDIVIADVRMPEMDGIELTKKIVEKEINVTIIVMSAYGSVENAIDAMKSGAYDYITKPFKADEVIYTLAKAKERENLRRENAELRAEVLGRSKFEGIIARSKSMEKIFLMITKVAEFQSTVLITGESGTGKEMVARAIHQKSPRRDKKFVAINCGAIPENLLESELFGYKKGAFTDAVKDKDGLFFEADEGTLLLDEVGELPLSLQVKLLRVLQENRIRPLGDTKDIKINIRIIAATVKDLKKEVENKNFREDLFYRLNVLPIVIPPLKERPGDVILLAEHFIKKHNRRLNTSVMGLTPQVEKMLLKYSWPGNVRELENTIERAMVLTEGDKIIPDDLPGQIRKNSDPVHMVLGSKELSIKKTFKAIEEELIRRALLKTGGNRTVAAKYLEISHRALLYKIKDYKIS